VELFPETGAAPHSIQALFITPEMPVFSNALGNPIEPKAFTRHWYACLRTLGIRQCGLYCTKNTFVTTALQGNSVWMVSPFRRHRHFGMPIAKGTDGGPERDGESLWEPRTEEAAEERSSTPARPWTSAGFEEQETLDWITAASRTLGGTLYEPPGSRF
jgi:hypothetical protein